MSLIRLQFKKPASVDKEIVKTAGRMRRFLPVAFLALAFLLLPAGSTLLGEASSSSTVPLINILSVVRDDSVTIRTTNFPANTTFTATMGPMGTRGVKGTAVGTVDSGTGGSFDATFSIPAGLKGSYQISIRLQSSGPFPYYSYNWFYNNTAGATVPTTGPVTTAKPETAPTPSYSGSPTFKITAVNRDTSASIETNNFPPNQTFTVTMGPMGTRGVNGTVVGTLESGSGGKLTGTYQIPNNLKGHAQISIRAQTSHANPLFAYNWFWNNDANTAMAAAPESKSNTGAGGQPASTTPVGGTGTGSSIFTGIPVMNITRVVRNQSVTFQTHNYPPNQTFNVTMGPMGTQGINGIQVGSFNSGQGGSFEVTMPIPNEYAGWYQISIRAQTAHAYPYSSYNWFYNNSTS